MNKMHAIAKIAAVMLGIYLLLSSLISLVSTVSMVSLMQRGKPDMEQWVVYIISVLAAGCFVAGVYYFLIYRSDAIARKIVKQDEIGEPACPTAWYSTALRLAVVIAGFFFLSKTIVLLSNVSMQIHLYLRSGQTETSLISYTASLLAYLAISIYLLCGAPQFVRWHLEKTKSQHKENQ